MPRIHLPSIQKNLFTWYRKNARALPWRKTKDPYKIWISEIMLQQTQVETVIPYYEKWIKAFPNTTALAKSSLSKVLKHWAGLGYYRRAHGLHLTAKIILKKYRGKIPDSIEVLRTLPGIGRYTAGALASIAYNKPAALLDGNVIRVLTRLYAIRDDIGSGVTLKRLWALAEKVVPDKNPGDFNQALMELGATVCIPDNPRCGQCPIQKYCLAYQCDDPLLYPVKLKKEETIAKETAALILRQGNLIYVEKQPAGGRWANLWMFPFWESRSKLYKENIYCEKMNPFMTIRHGFTKYQILLHVFKCPGNAKIKLSSGKTGRWIAVRDLQNYAFPSPHQKIVAKLISENGSRKKTRHNKALTYA